MARRPRSCAVRSTTAVVVLLLILGVLPLLAESAKAQGTDAEPYLEEIVVNFRVPKLVNQDIFVLYDGETVYLPMLTVFDLLGIHVEADFDNKRFHGDFISKDNPYVIDLTEGRVSCYGNRHVLRQSDYHLTETELYLEVNRYPELFQLPMSFTFSSLSVYMRRDNDFPAFQKLRRRLAHQALREEEATTLSVHRLPRTRDTFKGAAIDWQLSSNASKARRIHNFGIGTGAMLFGGDVTLSANGDSEDWIQTDQLNYRWHYHLDDRSEISQVDLGKFYTTGQYSRQIAGAAVTNKPVVQRKYHQTIQLSDYVGDGWEVELYVNGELEDFIYTGSDGEYNFLVDINYGSSRIELKLYGPNGEIRTEEQFLQVPFNLVPKGVFEYTAAAGQGQASYSDRTYLQGSGYYGLHDNVTAGLSSEFVLGEETQEPSSLTADVTYQPLGNLTVNGSYSPDYAVQGSANFRKLGWISANGSITKYFENETRNIAGRKFSALLSFSIPLRINKRYLALRYHMMTTTFANRTQINQNYGFSTSVAGVHLNYLGRWDWRKYSGRNDHSITSRIFGTLQAFRWALPQIQFEYDHSQKRFMRYGISLTRRVFRTGRLALSFQRDPVAGSNQVMLTFNLYNAFATFSSRVTRTEREVSVNQSQRGSILYDQEGGNVLFDRRNAVGLGSAVIRPFLDDNYNGEYDDGEEYLAGLRANIKGAGRRTHGEKRLYYYDRLRPYAEYMVEIDEVSLDNPMLKPTADHFSVTVNPNVVTAVEVPLVLGGEISGSVMRPRAVDTVGVSGVRVTLMNLTNESVTEVTTYAGGEFYNLGLIPGRYRAYVDPAQVERHGYIVQPEHIDFEIDPANGLDIVEGINFILIKQQPESTE